jgi:mannose-6-phosphate isomerase-like protein (cupin superfamily)
MTSDQNHTVQSPVASMDTVPGYWGFGSLWSPLVSSEQTHGRYSIVEQLMPGRSGPPPHTHERSDEVFYILEGQVQLQLGDAVSTARAGQLVRVPLGVTHGFVVTSDQARFLNFFVPATMDQMVAMVSAPAAALTVPPPGSDGGPSQQQMAEFMDRLREIASLSWSSQHDQLSELRHTAS